MILDRNTGGSPAVIETALITAFILPERRARYLSLLETRKGRNKLRRQLAHFSHWDRRFVRRIDGGVSAIWKALRDSGAPEKCHVLSEWDQIDAKEMDVGEVLSACVGYGLGTVLSCIPGRLAFYEAEGPGERFILERQK